MEYAYHDLRKTLPPWSTLCVCIDLIKGGMRPSAIEDGVEAKEESVSEFVDVDTSDNTDVETVESQEPETNGSISISHSTLKTQKVRQKVFIMYS